MNESTCIHNIHWLLTPVNSRDVIFATASGGYSLNIASGDSCLVRGYSQSAGQGFTRGELPGGY